MKEVKKVWGVEVWIVNNGKYCGKILKLDKDAFSSLHYHPIKEETFYVLKGKIKFKLEDEEMELKPGDKMHINPGQKHKFEGLEYSEMIEFSTQHSDDDVVRLSVSGRNAKNNI